MTNVLSDKDSKLKSYKPCYAAKLFEFDTDRFQNVHPLLGWYKHDMETGILSYDTFMDLIKPDNVIELLNLMTQIGVNSKG